MISQNKTRIMVSVAMLSAISYLLAFIEISVPLSPSFAKMDISDLPVLIAAFNLLKGLAISIVTMLIYKPLTPILKGRYEHDNKRISAFSEK